jgi:DNA polymerase
VSAVPSSDDMRTVTLASATDLEGFRRACRALWVEKIAPNHVTWRTAPDAEAGLFAAGAAVPAATAATAPPVYVPAWFMPLCESAILHPDPGHFALLYRLLWRLQTEPALRHDPLDPDRVAADEMARTARAGPQGAEVRPRSDAAPPRDGTPATLPDLRRALERCRDCPLGEHATQAVPGEGPARARLMFVGEQPGDQEDLRGRPFVGPAGQLLERALAQLGIDRREVYITNAVKHFKFELRGKRRIHKTPAQEEAAACLHWLENEIELVDPGALVALGATAARQLMGTAIAVTRQRGQWLQRADGRRVLVTLHPSALLRMEPEDKEAAYDAWLHDLGKAANSAGR